VLDFHVVRHPLAAGEEGAATPNKSVALGNQQMQKQSCKVAGH